VKELHGMATKPSASKILLDCDAIPALIGLLRLDSAVYRTIVNYTLSTIRYLALNAGVAVALAQSATAAAELDAVVRNREDPVQQQLASLIVINVVQSAALQDEKTVVCGPIAPLLLLLLSDGVASSTQRQALACLETLCHHQDHAAMLCTIEDPPLVDELIALLASPNVGSLHGALTVLRNLTLNAVACPDILTALSSQGYVLRLELRALHERLQARLVVWAATSSTGRGSPATRAIPAVIIAAQEEALKDELMSFADLGSGVSRQCSPLTIKRGDGNDDNEDVDVTVRSEDDTGSSEEEEAHTVATLVPVKELQNQFEAVRAQEMVELTTECLWFICSSVTRRSPDAVKPSERIRTFARRLNKEEQQT
jgi:hypothetical protein